MPPSPPTPKPPPGRGFLQSFAMCPAAPHAVHMMFAVTFGASGHSQLKKSID